MSKRMSKEEANRLEQTLENGDRSYYVYALCLQDGTPFYIGKGRGARVFAHEMEAEVLSQIDEDKALTQEEKQQFKKKFSDKIKTIIEANGTIERVIIKWGLTSNEAFMCESALINSLGFLVSKDKLPRLTNIVNGHASPPEDSSVADIKTKARTVEQFLLECAIEAKTVDDIGRKIAFISINKLYPSCLDANGLPEDWKIKESVRGFWSKLSLSKAKKIEFIFAIYRQRIVGIYHVTDVFKAKCTAIEAGSPLKNCLLDFPKYPERRIDWLKCAGQTLEAAKKNLSEADYAELFSILNNEAKEQSKTPDQVLKNFLNRVYFCVDDCVPNDILAYKNCFPTMNGTTDFIRRGHIQYQPVILNF